jgi:hypothetical protein
MVISTGLENSILYREYINIETVPGMGGKGIKENDGGGEFKCDIL